MKSIARDKSSLYRKAAQVATISASLVLVASVGVGASTITSRVAAAASTHRFQGLTVAPRGALNIHALARTTAARPHLVRPHATQPAKTYIVNSTADDPLATSGSVNCVDTQGGSHCSLRAAVQAANNLNRPVVIELAATTYDITDSALGSLLIENTGGTSIIGKTMAGTKIHGELSVGWSVFSVGENSGRGSSLQLTDLTVNGGNANEGGGIYQDGANTSVVLDSVAVTDNNANYGGGVYCTSGNFWATNSTISSNTVGFGTEAGDGGGIDASSSNIELANTTVNSNVAGDTSNNGDGGGIYNESSLVEISGGSVSGNRAGTSSESGDGGGIYNDYGTTIATHTQISHDVVYGSGGGDLEYWSHLEASDVTFTGDQAFGADASGGALQVDETANVELDGVTMTHDTTTGVANGDGGGAINDYGYEDGDLLTVNNSTISSDTTSAVVLDGEEGGLAASFTGTTFQGDSSSLSYSAGAIDELDLEYGGVAVSLNGDTFTHNVSTGEYGSGAVVNYAGEYSGNSLDATNCTFTDNTGDGYEATGAVLGVAYEYAEATVSLVNSTLSGNHAPHGGEGEPSPSGEMTTTRAHSSPCHTTW